METTGLIQPQKNEEKAARLIQEIAVRLSNAQTKGELGLILVREIQRLHDVRSPDHRGQTEQRD